MDVEHTTIVTTWLNDIQSVRTERETDGQMVKDGQIGTYMRTINKVLVIVITYLGKKE